METKFPNRNLSKLPTVQARVERANLPTKWSHGRDNANGNGLQCFGDQYFVTVMNFKWCGRDMQWRLPSLHDELGTTVRGKYGGRAMQLRELARGSCHGHGGKPPPLWAWICMTFSI